MKHSTAYVALTTLVTTLGIGITLAFLASKMYEEGVENGIEGSATNALVSVRELINSDTVSVEIPGEGLRAVLAATAMHLNLTDIAAMIMQIPIDDQIVQGRVRFSPTDEQIQAATQSLGDNPGNLSAKAAFWFIISLTMFATVVNTCLAHNYMQNHKLKQQYLKKDQHDIEAPQNEQSSLVRKSYGSS